VLDAGGGERAAQVHAALDRAGFIMLEPRDAPPGMQGSEVLYRAGRDGLADVVKGFFPQLEVSPASKGILRGAAVAVLVGSDFPTPA
jgi:hypothetical protein